VHPEVYKQRIRLGAVAAGASRFAAVFLRFRFLVGEAPLASAISEVWFHLEQKPAEMNEEWGCGVCVKTFTITSARRRGVYSTDNKEGI
jgi:hypothetical protein